MVLREKEVKDPLNLLNFAQHSNMTSKIDFLPQQKNLICENDSKNDEISAQSFEDRPSTRGGSDGSFIVILKRHPFEVIVRSLVTNLHQASL